MLKKLHGGEWRRHSVQSLMGYSSPIENLTECQSILDAIDEEILIVDCSHRVLLANRCMLEANGLKAADVIGHPCYEVSHAYSTPCEQPGHPCPLAEVCSSMRPTRTVHVHLTQDARGRYVEIVASPLLDSRGNVVAIIEAMRDITKAKQAEMFREQYISLISHDLRQPLTALTGFADLLHRVLLQKGLDREANSAASVLKSARRMNAMIQDLVESVRLEAGTLEMHKEPTDLVPLLRDIAQRVDSPKDLARIRVEAAEEFPSVATDPERIERVVVNLLTNAVKYSPPHAPVVMRVTRNADEVIVSVADQGVGIPAEDLPHLFERFYRARTEQKVEGLGLGLYISRLIVQSHGGRIWVDSEVGRGSTFSFTLPLSC